MIHDHRVLEQLRKDEGFRKKAYRDTNGLLTIGYGTLIEHGISREEAELLLCHRFNKKTAELYRRADMDFPGPVQEALVNMAYQMGVSGLLKFKNTWKYLKAWEFENAAREAMDSDWARKHRARAKRVTNKIRDGKHYERRHGEWIRKPQPKGKGHGAIRRKSKSKR